GRGRARPRAVPVGVPDAGGRGGLPVVLRLRRRRRRGRPGQRPVQPPLQPSLIGGGGSVGYRIVVIGFHAPLRGGGGGRGVRKRTFPRALRITTCAEKVRFRPVHDAGNLPPRQPRRTRIPARR